MIYYLELLFNLERCLLLIYKNKKSLLLKKTFFTFFQKGVFNTYHFSWSYKN